MQTLSKKPPKFWYSNCSDKTKYETGMNKEVSCKTGKSAYVQSLDAEKTDWGCLQQTFEAYYHRNKCLRFTAKIKTQGVIGEAGLYMQVLSANRSLLLQDSRADRFLTETTNWTECSAVLNIPENARWINIGAVLRGTGKVWIDERAVQEVGQDIPTTDSRSSNL